MASKAELNLDEITCLDKQIETLLECKPLSENEVKKLCDRVWLFKDGIDPNLNYRQKKF